MYMNPQVFHYITAVQDFILQVKILFRCSKIDRGALPIAKPILFSVTQLLIATKSACI